MVEQVASQVFIPLTVGGGIRTLDDIRRMLIAGADKISINTAAIKNPDFVGEASARFGAQCIVVAIDAKCTSLEGEAKKWEIFTHGGRNATGIDAIEWAVQMEQQGAGEILLTSMDRDGASGGITNLDDIRSLSEVAEEGIEGAITGRAIYEGTLDFAEAQKLADEICTYTEQSS